MSKIKSTYFSRNRNPLAAIGWINLRSLGESRMVQTSYYWLILVPICARLLENVASPIRMSIFGGDHLISVALPFSWYLLYFSALAFASGAILYRVYCPTIVSEFANFREFKETGGEGFRLVDEIERALPSSLIHDSPIWKAFTLAADKYLGPDKEERGGNVDLEVTRGVRRMPIDGLASIFFTIRSVVNHSHPTAIRITALFFGLGILSLAIVFLQNINFVIIQLNGEMQFLPRLP